MLYTGQYSFWNGIVKYDFQTVNTAGLEVSSNFDSNLFKHSAIKYFLIQYVIESYETGLLIVDGEYCKIDKK